MAMSWLLDTNVVAELRKGERCDRHVDAWFENVADEDLFLSVIVVGEIRGGIEALRRRDPPAAEALDAWLARLVSRHTERILIVDQAVAEEWGRIDARTPLPDADGLLAATAQVHGL